MLIPNDISVAFDKAAADAVRISTSAGALQARLDVLREEEARTLREKQKHEVTLEKVPVALELLQALYEQSSGELIRSCEDAMSDAVQAVVDSKSRIGIDAEVSNNQIRANIGTAQYLKDGTRILRDIMSNEGGGLTNVVSTSLRAISIVRSGQRRFMILDEPNCWLNPSQIPAFSRIIEGIARRAGFQIIMLTHHGVDNFDADANIIHLEKIGDEVKETATYEADLETPGIISSIELTNYGKHPHLYIPLRAGLNIITGDSNVGKSRILSAFRAVVCGTGVAGDIHMQETDDGFVHMEKSAAVKICFDGGKSVEWVRRKSGSPVESWTYTDPSINGVPEVDGIVCAGRNGKAWVGKPGVLNIQEISGYFPSLHLQKNASFALDDSKALASLISISPTSVRLHNMIAIVSEKKKEANSEIKRIDGRLRLLSEEIHVLDRDLVVLKQGIQNSDRILENVQALMASNDAMSTLYTTWSENKAKYETQVEISKLHLDAPELPDIDGKLELIARYDEANLNHWLHSSISTCSLDMPGLPELDEKKALYGKYRDAEKSLHREKSLAKVFLEIPELPPVEDKIALLERYSSAALEHWLHESISSLALDAPVLPDSSGKKALLERYNAEKRKYQMAEQVKSISMEIPEGITSGLKVLSEQRTLLDKFTKTRDALKNEVTRYQDIQASLASVESDIAALRSSINVCPLCGHVCNGNNGHG